MSGGAHAGGGAPAMLALHGFTGTGEDFAALRARWRGRAGAGWEVVAPDIAGHGESPVVAGMAGEEAFVAAGDRVLAAAEGRAGGAAGGLILLGYSMGGRLGLHLVLRRPERFRAVVLVGATPGISDALERARREEADVQQAARLVADGMEGFARRWERSPIIESQRRIPEPFGAELRARRRRQDPRKLAWALAALGTGVMPPQWDRLPGLNVPVLLLTGEEDLKFEEIARRMQAQLPDAVHRVIPEAGHCAHLEQPAAAARAIAHFLGERGLGG